MFLDIQACCWDGGFVAVWFTQLVDSVSTDIIISDIYKGVTCLHKGQRQGAPSGSQSKTEISPESDICALMSAAREHNLIVT